jgi:hypothetical protein
MYQWDAEIKTIFETTNHRGVSRELSQMPELSWLPMHDSCMVMLP